MHYDLAELVVKSAVCQYSMGISRIIKLGFIVLACLLLQGMNKRARPGTNNADGEKGDNHVKCIYADKSDGGKGTQGIRRI
jgi:hypothetical protein